MARPIKKGLEYFPKDTDCFSDRKIRRLLNTHGLKGYVIYEYILCLIYKDQGYFINYTNDLCFDVADFLKDGLTEDQVKEVIISCVEIGLFHKILFTTSNILTGSGIQSRYKSAKRTGVIDAKMRVIADETPVMDAETPVITSISTQRKVKESKVNKSKGEESKENETPTFLPPPQTETDFNSIVPENLKFTSGFMQLWEKWVTHSKTNFRAKFSTVVAESQLRMLGKETYPIETIEKALRRGRYDLWPLDPEEIKKLSTAIKTIPKNGTANLTAEEIRAANKAKYAPVKRP